MLVLTRKTQEKIRIGENITITVVKTKGNSVRLGIEAPGDVTVLRGELLASLASRSPDTKPKAKTDEKTAGEAHFVRAPKSRVRAILPDLLGDAGPLRELLDRRAEVTT